MNYRTEYDGTLITVALSKSNLDALAALYEQDDALAVICRRVGDGQTMLRVVVESDPVHYHSPDREAAVRGERGDVLGPTRGLIDPPIVVPGPFQAPETAAVSDQEAPTQELPQPVA